MPDCNYCDASFDDEQSYLEHLDGTHRDELGSIDRRRVDEAVGDEDGETIPTGPAVLGIVFLIAIAVVAYVLFFTPGQTGGESGTVNGFDVAQTPGPVSQDAHEHGLLTVTIDGRQIDFSQPQYQYRQTGFDAFHFEGGNGRVWHKHASGVTLEYAMATLGIGVNESSVTIDGTTYRDSDPGTTVEITVDGESVDPSSYELSGASDQNPESGDTIRITVTTE